MSDIELINPDQYQQVRSNRYQQTPILHTLQQQQQQRQSSSTSPKQPHQQQQQYSINTSSFPYRRSPYIQHQNYIHNHNNLSIQSG